MSETALGKAETSRVPVPMHAPGTAWFGAMAALWGAFVTLLAASPATLDDAYDWLTGLPIVWEVVMWIVTLPWALAYLIYESSWEHWLRVLVVAVVVTAHLSISAPRVPR